MNNTTQQLGFFFSIGFKAHSNENKSIPTKTKVAKILRLDRVGKPDYYYSAR